MIARHPGGCKPHEYQDQRYGPGFRVMNPVATKSNEEKAYRCTVCAPPKEATKKRGGVFRLSELVVKR